MSAIAGMWNIAGGVESAPPLSAILQAQSAFGPDSLDWLEREDYACGRCLYRILSEDRFDRQPLLSPDERFILVADLRIDNRDELAGALAIDPVELAATSDSSLLMRGLLAWGEAVLERMIGDFAFAWFDRRDRLLLLARDTAGERPLHYLHERGIFAFASMPQALAGAFGKGVNPRRLAEFVSDLPNVGDESFFENIRRIEPGHVLRASPGRISIRRYWEPRGPTLRLPDPGAYGEALRDEIDQAVNRRLRRAGGGVAAHLSSGFDSSAVASSAAIQCAALGEDVAAFTSAPAAAVEAAPDRRFADESDIAAATARLHPNLRHRIIRAQADPIDDLGETHLLAGQPVGSLFNHGWWQAIDRAAASDGAKVLLTGEMGNFTLSWGRGLTPLGDLFRTARWRQLVHESRLLSGDHSWLSLAHAAIGGAIAKPIYRLGRRLAGRDAQKARDFPFLSEGHKRRVAERHRKLGWDWRPPLNGDERRWRLQRMADPGCFRKMALARWGIEERDPTADRRLTEFCYSLPVEARLKDGIERPALRVALAGRVADEVLATRLRGFQSADWYRRVDPGRLDEFVRKRDDGGEVIEISALRDAIARWPRSGWEDRRIIYLYAQDVMRAVSALDFHAVAPGRQHEGSLASPKR